MYSSACAFGLWWCLAFRQSLLVQSLHTLQPSDDAHGAAVDFTDVEVEAPDDDDDEDSYPFYKEDLTTKMPPRKMNQQEDCKGCDLTIDMSCPYKFQHRSGYFHRLADCLVPGYGLLEAAKAASGTVCVLTYPAPPNMLPFFNTLFEDKKNFRYIDYQLPCAESLPRHAVDPSPVKDAERKYLDAFPALKNVASRYQIDFMENLRAFHRDIAKVATPPQDPTLVLLARRGHTRAFVRETEASLADMMKGIASEHRPGRPQLTYKSYAGEESLRETFEIFMNSAGIVGYHGAAHVNALFTTRKCCTIEITPYQNQENTIEWRSNMFLANESSLLQWEKFHLTFKELIAPNKAQWAFLSQKKFRRTPVEKKIKWLNFVEISSSQVKALRDVLAGCLEHAF